MLREELEAALVRELRSSYRDLCATYFRGLLRPAAIMLSNAEGRLGRWDPSSRTIEISRVLVLEQPWGVVVEVLKHEMAHQYVHETLGLHDERPHGSAFRDVCRQLGIDGAAAGLPDVAACSKTAQHERVLERVARLLALAESPNMHEAQAAMSAAQRLMLKYNVEAVRQRLPRAYGFRHLGRPTGRVTESERLLAAILSGHFFVEVIWVPVYRVLEQKRGSVLEVCGSEANLEMAAYAHAFLSHTAEQLWAQHKREQRIGSNRDRRTYLAGVMAGFLEKLDAQRSHQREQGLVWVRDADLGQYYRARHPRIAHVRFMGNRRTEAHAHGREAGRRIVLHRPITETARNGGKLLPR